MSIDISKIEDGDRVRVVLEGEVVDQGGGFLAVGSGYSRNVICPVSEHVVSIEVIAPPKPDEPTLPHAVVRDAHGQVRHRGRSGLWYSVSDPRGVEWDDVPAVEVLFPGAEDES